MFDIRTYKSIPGVKNVDGVVEYFLSTLLASNRRWAFYVDWAKVDLLVKKFKVELGILEAVIDSPESEFKATIKKYPSVVRVFPRLLAIRDDKFSILEDPFKKRFLHYDFSTEPKTSGELDYFYKFWVDSGLKQALKEVKNLRDYYFGLEVGSDTNARKNRGGTEWEDLIEPVIREIAERNGYKVEIRQKFEKVLKRMGHEVPKELCRNMDFLVYKGNKFVDIEANYFSGAGTKLEVPGAYVNRTLNSRCSLALFLFTDGFGWRVTRQRVHEFFEKFPCVVNYQMAKVGILERGLKDYLDK